MKILFKIKNVKNHRSRDNQKQYPVRYPFLSIIEEKNLQKGIIKLSFNDPNYDFGVLNGRANPARLHISAGRIF